MQTEPTPRQRVRRMDRLHAQREEAPTDDTSLAREMDVPEVSAPEEVSAPPQAVREENVLPIYSVQARRAVSYRPIAPPEEDQDARQLSAFAASISRPASRRSIRPDTSGAVQSSSDGVRASRDVPAQYDAPPPIERRKADAPAVPAAPPMPRWLTACLCVMLAICMVLGGAQAWMTVYLRSQEQARADAHQALLDAHPLTYRAFIEQYAREYNLQPAFVASIILNESSYRTNAESKVGARGLMQLMPSTAEWIAGKLRVKDYSFDQLWDAETNIRFGCWYLNYLADRFDGDPVAVTAAYHAGQGQVAAWLKDRSMSPDGRTLQVANMIEGPTKVYAGRVTRHYAIYDALFYHTFNPAPDSADAAVDNPG